MNWIKRLGHKFGGNGKPQATSHAQPSLTLEPAHIARKPASGVPRFHSMASDQLDRRFADKFMTARLKLRDAYIPAQPVTDAAMFAGREALLTTMIRAVEDRHVHMILFGERGIGKTSLLHVLAQRAREARYHVSYVSCGAAAAFDETFRAVAAQIPLLFHEDYGPTSAEAERGATLVDLLPETEISPSLASELCAKVVGTRVLVILDEFERPKSLEFRRYVGEFLKNLSDRSVRVHLVIAGVASNLADLLEPGGFVQRNIIALEVPKMTNSEVSQLIHNGEAVSGLTFEPTALDALVFAANGLPYLASLLGQQSGLTALSAQRLTVTRADIPYALADALNEIKGRLSKRMSASVARCIRDGSFYILGSLASAAQERSGRLSIDEVAALFPTAQLATQGLKELERLNDHGIVNRSQDEKTGPHFQFGDPNALAYMWLLAVERQLSSADDEPNLALVLAADRAGKT